jgi:hypothetical protein
VSTPPDAEGSAGFMTLDGERKLTAELRGTHPSPKKRRRMGHPVLLAGQGCATRHTQQGRPRRDGLL